MKLQKQAGRAYTNKDGKTVRYDKWVVVIPPDLIETLGWKEGLELAGAAKAATLTLRPARE